MAKVYQSYNLTVEIKAYFSSDIYEMFPSNYVCRRVFPFSILQKIIFFPIEEQSNKRTEVL